ncbi:hypothetical protein [Botrimarina sp.]|uniref:hypothetical protein n=1 Tax=Botrimarina sp. TaxID=2795802 RepID=UPI0032ECCB9D
MTRRRFAFWIGMGLFGVGERLRAESLDAMAAALMRSTEVPAPPPPALPEPFVAPAMPVHWQATHNHTWRWVQREEYLGGQWRLTGMTTPVHRRTGEPLEGGKGYLDEEAVPERFRLEADNGGLAADGAEQLGEPHGEDSVPAAVEAPGPDAVEARRLRHGRPPSRWLRSLTAAELSVWLATVEPPEATVEGMTFAVHLTRDHGFADAPVAGLTYEEQAKLHGAAHHGY